MPWTKVSIGIFSPWVICTSSFLPSNIGSILSLPPHVPITPLYSCPPPYLTASYFHILYSTLLFSGGSCSLYRASHQSSTFLPPYCGTSALTPHPPSLPSLSCSPSFSHSFSPAKSALVPSLPLDPFFTLQLWPSH